MKIKLKKERQTLFFKKKHYLDPKYKHLKIKLKMKDCSCKKHLFSSNVLARARRDSYQTSNMLVTISWALGSYMPTENSALPLTPTTA